MTVSVSEDKELVIEIRTKTNMESSIAPVYCPQNTILKIMKIIVVCAKNLEKWNRANVIVGYL